MLRRMIDRSCSPTDYRVVLPDNGTNVGAPCHPRLAIGSTVLTNNRGLNPLSIQGHGPNWWAWKLFSNGERTMTYCDPRALPAHTHTHTHTKTHTQILLIPSFYQVQWSISEPTRTPQTTFTYYFTPMHAHSAPWLFKLQWWASHTHTILLQ